MRKEQDRVSHERKNEDHSLGRTSSEAQIGQFQESPFFSISLEVKAQCRLLGLDSRSSHCPLGMTSSMFLEKEVLAASSSGLMPHISCTEEQCHKYLLISLFKWRACQKDKFEMKP